jgi:hypothetical protein
MENSKTTESKITIDVLEQWKENYTKRISLTSTSRRNINNSTINMMFHTKRDECFILVDEFFKTNPLKNNDYVKYISCYISEGKKLNPKFFRNDISKLEEYYSKYDEAKKNGIIFNPFNWLNYKNYVVFMVLKLKGEYNETDDLLFNVQTIDHREYNPLTKNPSVLRGELPFEVKEYDIVRAFPSFIDIELGMEFKDHIYESIDKKTFAVLLNSNKTNSLNDLNTLRAKLNVVYGDYADKVLTDKRFNNKGQAFLDFSKYEKDYVERFVKENNIDNYVRLHDGVYVLSDYDCEKLKFENIEFSIKECIKPTIENDICNFYDIDDSGKVITSRHKYADFFIQEKFLRISTAEDKFQLIHDSNNVVNFFNHKTDIVSFLESNINEPIKYRNLIRETIAKECNTAINNSFNLIPSTKLVYYSDSKNNFGLPFKNGFFYFDENIDIQKLASKNYSEVEGFFAPHKIQNRQFTYTDEIGMFEKFMARVSTGKEFAHSPDDLNVYKEFNKMFGYLCHTFKNQTNSPCIIFTDEGANDENRNGGRGKTIITKALAEVQTVMLKGGKEFDANYTHVFADLERKHNVYIIDDVPAAFNYDDLYTNILGSINCQRKGLKAELIEFEQTPKFVITTNWVVRYDEKNSSTNRRFLEYKFSDYYNQSKTPLDDFGCTFFQDWDQMEWNRFYSFVFRCVSLFISEGLQQIQYNKDRDNFLAYFNNTAMLQEFERIIWLLIDNNSEFIVRDFLSIYNESPLRQEKLFSIRNVKKLIDVWHVRNQFDNPDITINYQQSGRKWVVSKN